jgi:hypothetical protein
MKQIGGSLTLLPPVTGRVSGFEARLVSLNQIEISGPRINGRGFQVWRSQAQ